MTPKDKQDFECHVTVPFDETMESTYSLIGKVYNWKTSYIKGDPLLGNKNHFYFTCHSNNFDAIKSKMLDLVDSLKDHKIKVLRQKIELIMLDDRF